MVIGKLFTHTPQTPLTTPQREVLRREHVAPKIADAANIVLAAGKQPHEWLSVQELDAEAVFPAITGLVIPRILDQEKIDSDAYRSLISALTQAGGEVEVKTLQLLSDGSFPSITEFHLCVRNANFSPRSQALHTLKTRFFGPDIQMYKPSELP